MISADVMWEMEPSIIAGSICSAAWRGSGLGMAAWGPCQLTAALSEAPEDGSASLLAGDVACNLHPALKISSVLSKLVGQVHWRTADQLVPSSCAIWTHQFAQHRCSSGRACDADCAGN